MKKPILKADRKLSNHHRPGWVYIMHDGNLHKIGLSRRPKVRKYYLERDYGSLDLIFAFWVFDMKWLEEIMHDRYNRFRVYRNEGSGKTEWFYFGSIQISEVILKLIWYGVLIDLLGLVAIGTILSLAVAVLAVLGR